MQLRTGSTIGCVDVVITVLSGLVLLAFATAAVAAHVLGRANRLVPGTATPAPLGWLWSPRTAARLHRRLKRSLSAARTCAELHGRDLGLVDLVSDLERHAVALDRELVVADRLPHPNRSRALRELRAEVRQVDALAERIIRNGRAWSGTEPSAREVTGVAERLDALESAVADLSRLEGQVSPAASVEDRARRSKA